MNEFIDIAISFDDTVTPDQKNRFLELLIQAVKDAGGKIDIIYKASDGNLRTIKEGRV